MDIARGVSFPSKSERFSTVLTLQTMYSQMIRHVAFSANSSRMLMGMQQEIERLHLQHHMMSVLFGGRLHWAPIDPHPQKILDIGTGTGSWAVDIADMYPSAHVGAPKRSPEDGNKYIQDEKIGQLTILTPPGHRYRLKPYPKQLGSTEPSL